MAATKMTRDLYNGNAAYDLSYVDGVGSGVRQPDPLARPHTKSRTRTRTQTKLRVRKQQKVSPMAVAGFLAVAALAIVVLLSYANLVAVSDRVVHLQNDLASLEEQGEILKAKYERTFNLNAIEEQFTSLGAMAKPRTDQVVYIDMSEPDHAQVIQDEGQSASDGVKDFFTMAVEYFK